jgi:hypothetical protein
MSVFLFGLSSAEVCASVFFIFFHEARAWCISLSQANNKGTAAERLIVVQAVASSVLGQIIKAEDIEACVAAAVPLFAGVATTLPAQVALLICLQGASCCLV